MCNNMNRFTSIFLLGLLLTNAAAAAEEIIDNTSTQRRLSSKSSKNSKNGKNNSSSSSSSSKTSKNSKATSSSADFPNPNKACNISNLRQCCLNGNAAVCILDYNCSYDRCGTCPKSLFNDCCSQTQLADLAFCQTELGCDLTQCGPTRRPNRKPNKKKKNKRKLLVEAVKSNGEGIKKIYQ